MKNKKLVSFFVAFLLLVMVSPASAAGDGAEGVEPVIEANMQFAAMALEEVEVQVNVPTEKKLYINPLGFPVDMGDHTDNRQIIMEPAYIENMGDTPVNVSVSVTGSLVEGSAMTLSSSSTKALATTSKKAFIYFELKAVSDPDSVSWDKEYDAEKHVPVRIMTKTRKNIVELDEAGGSKPYGAFRLTGDCVTKPKNPWTVADGIKVVVAFTFKPVITIS